MRRRLGTALATALGLVALTACGGSEPSAPAAGAVNLPMTVENCDRPPVTFDASPQRVMAMGSETATLFWLA